MLAAGGSPLPNATKLADGTVDNTAYTTTFNVIKQKLSDI